MNWYHSLSLVPEHRKRWPIPIPTTPPRAATATILLSQPRTFRITPFTPARLSRSRFRFGQYVYNTGHPEFQSTHSFFHSFTTRSFIDITLTHSHHAHSTSLVLSRFHLFISASHPRSFPFMRHIHTFTFTLQASRIHSFKFVVSCSPFIPASVCIPLSIGSESPSIYSSSSLSVPPSLRVRASSLTTGTAYASHRLTASSPNSLNSIHACAHQVRAISC